MRDCWDFAHLLHEFTVPAGSVIAAPAIEPRFFLLSMGQAIDHHEGEDCVGDTSMDSIGDVSVGDSISGDLDSGAPPLARRYRAGETIGRLDLDLKIDLDLETGGLEDYERHVVATELCEVLELTLDAFDSMHSHVQTLCLLGMDRYRSAEEKKFIFEQLPVFRKLPTTDLRLLATRCVSRRAGREQEVLVMAKRLADKVVILTLTLTLIGGARDGETSS